MRSKPSAHGPAIIYPFVQRERSQARPFVCLKTKLCLFPAPTRKSTKTIFRNNRVPLCFAPRSGSFNRNVHVPLFPARATAAIRRAINVGVFLLLMQCRLRGRATQCFGLQIDCGKTSLCPGFHSEICGSIVSSCHPVPCTRAHNHSLLILSVTSALRQSFRVTIPFFPVGKGK